MYTKEEINQLLIEAYNLYPDNIEINKLIFNIVIYLCFTVFGSSNFLFFIYTSFFIIFNLSTMLYNC